MNCNYWKKVRHDPYLTYRESDGVTNQNHAAQSRTLDQPGGKKHHQKGWQQALISEMPTTGAETGPQLYFLRIHPKTVKSSVWIIPKHSPKNK